MKELKYVNAGSLADGFSDSPMERSGALTGKSILLYLEDGARVRIDFISATRLESIFYGEGAGLICDYVAVKLREDIFFLDYIIQFGYTRSISIVMNLRTGQALVIRGELPVTEEFSIPLLVRAKEGLPLSATKLMIDRASIDTPFNIAQGVDCTTADLIGKRLRFRYSSNAHYEHYYLNAKFFTWHCLAGKEKGLCDTDRCFYYKVEEDLYCFVWAEKIVQTLGVALEDLRTMRSYGKLFGYTDFEEGEVTNIPTGSEIEIV